MNVYVPFTSCIFSPCHWSECLFVPAEGKCSLLPGEGRTLHILVALSQSLRQCDGNIKTAIHDKEYYEH